MYEKSPAGGQMNGEHSEAGSCLYRSRRRGESTPLRTLASLVCQIGNRLTDPHSGM